MLPLLLKTFENITFHLVVKIELFVLPPASKREYLCITASGETHIQTSSEKSVAIFRNWPNISFEMYLLIFMLAFALAKGENGVSLIKFGEPSTVSIKEDQLFKVSLDALTSNSGKSISIL